MNIQSDNQYMIFNKYDKMTIGISRKNQDGQYENAYLPVRFKGSIKLADRTKIYIKKGFLTFSKYLKDNKTLTYWYVMVTEYETITETIKNTKKDVFEEFGEELELDDSDLPF